MLSSRGQFAAEPPSSHNINVIFMIIFTASAIRIIVKLMFHVQVGIFAALRFRSGRPNNYWSSQLIPYCRSLIKVKFPTDQIRPALGSCCRLIVVNHSQKTSKLPYFRLFRPIPKYFLPLGKPSFQKSAVFLKIVQKAFAPPPFYLNICPILQGVFFKRVFEH